MTIRPGCPPGERCGRAFLPFEPCQHATKSPQSEEIQADRALEGWRRFGKGRHRAALNLGDCFTYGLAVAVDHPVLCVGDDFVRTDVEVVPLEG